jgi:antitoxin component YwqK of YwqJK toxin-antitoxin module
MLPPTLTSLGLLTFLTGIGLPPAGEGYLSYEIPPDAVRVGPWTVRDSIPREGYNYFLPRVARERKNQVGTEIFQGTQIIQRELLWKGKRHGVQREWHPNGVPKNQAPYNQGQMDGLFQHWDEQGRLVGRYEMRGGRGTCKLYDSQGTLVLEQEFFNSMRNGLTMEISPISKRRSITWTKDGETVGQGCNFYPDGGLQLIAWGKGPLIYFKEDGSLDNTVWRIDGQKVTEAQYAAAAGDPALPPYFPDATLYKQQVAPEIRELLKKYQETPRVKIPLEFDAQGQPVPGP